MTKKIVFSLLLCATCLFSCDRFAERIRPDAGKNPVKPLAKYPNRVIMDWNKMIVQAMGGPFYEHYLLFTHINAMTHLAMHDALNSVAPVYQPYAYHKPDPQAEPIAAAASAAHTVMSNFFPTKQLMLDSALAVSLQSVPEGDAKTRGIALGKEAGAAILVQRQQDPVYQDPYGPITPSNVPGVYQAVPPYNFVFGPFWKDMQPFALSSPSQFRSAPLPVLNSDVYTRDYNEVKAYGDKNSAVRTADQTFYARFWYEGSEVGWNTIAGVVAADKKLDLLATARLFALVNMAMADSYTAGWDSKFHYNFWRPYTAIRAGATDGNPNTEPDAGWESLLETPSIPDYPSTHSVLGNASATILASVVGDKTKFTFSSSTGVPATATRSFKSFSEAAKENADSRIMAGVHFRFACEAGMEMGYQIGKWTVENHLRPLAPAK
ncbi:MAG: vanadium-dependent haloperoxidase [Cytophagales bacterium]|nr:vanadium-dependent haloperoxidase [Cytophagales bacterium]